MSFAGNMYSAKEIQNQAVPEKICCKSCEKWKPSAQFSKKQLADLRFKLRVHGYSSAIKIIRCIACTGGQTLELECIMCGQVKPLQMYAKTHRKNPDQAKCYGCMAQLDTTAPDDRKAVEQDDGSVLYEDDDRTETGTISDVTSVSGMSTVNSIWEMTTENEYATSDAVSESSGGVSLNPSTAGSSVANSSVGSRSAAAPSVARSIGRDRSSAASSASAASSLSDRFASVRLANHSPSYLDKGKGRAGPGSSFFRNVAAPYGDESESSDDDDDDDDDAGTHIASGGGGMGGGPRPAARNTYARNATGSSVAGSVGKENETKLPGPSSVRSRLPSGAVTPLSQPVDWTDVKPAAGNSRVGQPSIASSVSVSTVKDGPAIGYTGYDPTGVPHAMERTYSTTDGFAPRYAIKTPRRSEGQFPKVRPTQIPLGVPKTRKPDEGHRVLRLEEDSSSDEEDEGPRTDHPV